LPDTGCAIFCHPKVVCSGGRTMLNCRVLVGRCDFASESRDVELV
jgi:hypothetical protein